jgi:hypothetical protein
VFALLYSVAMVLELGEEWRDPWFTGGFLLAAGAAALTGMTRAKFLALLVAATGYFLFFRFPEVANHVNLMLCLNIALIAVLTHSSIRRRDPGEWYAAVLPVLRLGLILVYFLAGFHKLNRDFFDPEASCATNILDSVIDTAQLRILGVPLVLITATAGALAGWRLIRGGRFGSPGSRVFTGVVVLIGIAGIAAVPAALMISEPAIRGTVIGMVVALSVIGWELVGGLLLTVPRLQAAVLALSLTMHALLMLIGFVDFGALAVALLFAFVPAGYQQVLIAHGTRVYVYLGISLAVALLSGFDAQVHRVPEIALLTGALFNLAVLLLIWPILATVCSSGPRPAWGGVPVLDRRMPAVLYLVPLVLVFVGLTPYLGLRTAGNFSMFSNLRTEGESSNHLLLEHNPLKLWDYQDDVVWIVDIDDRYGRIIHHYDGSPRGYALPVIEFRKWIHDWTSAGYRVPLTFGYRGHLYRTDDIVTDPAWRTTDRTPEMVLQDFRVIQPGSPNWCRW